MVQAIVKPFHKSLFTLQSLIWIILKLFLYYYVYITINELSYYEAIRLMC